MFGGAELDFHYPIFTTCFHMVVQFVLCCTAMWLMVDWRPNVELDQPLMTSKFYFVRIAPAGLATGMDIGLGNWSLRFVTLIFYSKSDESFMVTLSLPEDSDLQVINYNVGDGVCSSAGPRKMVLEDRRDRHYNGFGSQFDRVG